MQHSTFMEEHRKLLLKNEDLMAWKSPRLRDPTPPPPMTLTATNATTAAVDPPPTPDPPAEVAAGPGLVHSPVPLLTRHTKQKSLIPLDKQSFCFHKDGNICGAGHVTRDSSSVKAQSGTVKKTVEAINNPKCSDEQNVLASRKASPHKSARRIFRSVSLIDTNQFDEMKLHLGQIRKSVKEPLATTSSRGRAAEKRELLSGHW